MNGYDERAVQAQQMQAQQMQAPQAQQMQAPQAPAQTGAQAPAASNMTQNIMSQLSPTMRQQLAAMPEAQRMQALQRLTQDYKGQRGVADDQMAMAEQLRASAPKAEGRNSGRIYTAANPLEHIGRAYQQRKATDMQQSAIDDKKKLAEDYGLGVQDVMQQMLKEEK